MASFFGSLFKPFASAVSTIVNNVFSNSVESVVSAVEAKNGSDMDKLAAGHDIADGVLNSVKSSVSPVLSLVNAVTKSHGLDIQNSLQAAADTTHDLIDGVGYGVLNTVIGAIALDKAADTPLEKLAVGGFIAAGVLATVDSAIDPIFSLVDTVSKQSGLDISAPLEAASETAHDLIEGVGYGVLNTVVGAIALDKAADTPAQKLAVGHFIADGVLEAVDSAIDPIASLIDSVSRHSGNDISAPLQKASDAAHDAIDYGHDLLDSIVDTIAVGLQLHDFSEQQMAIV